MKLQPLTTTVGRFAFYHGGDVIYELQEVPGLSHEECLEAVPEEA